MVTSACSRHDNDLQNAPDKVHVFTICILDPDPQGSRGAAGMIYSELEGKYQNFVSTFWFEFCWSSATSPPISVHPKNIAAIFARKNPFNLSMSSYFEKLDHSISVKGSHPEGQRAQLFSRRDNWKIPRGNVASLRKCACGAIIPKYFRMFWMTSFLDNYTRPERYIKFPVLTTGT